MQYYRNKQDGSIFQATLDQGSDFANGGLRANSIELTRELNTSREIYVRTDVVANSTLYLTTLGWLELF